MITGEMKTFVESLSLGSGAILVAILSTGIVWLLCSVFPATLRKLWVAIVPFTFAYCLYWSPVWLGADSSEYHAWAFVFVFPWFLAGAIPSAAIVLILEKRRSR
jgi:hypothetical protein